MTYTLTSYTDFITTATVNNWHNAIFVFAQEYDLSKLSTAPNVTMQFTSFDEELPLILVLTDECLIPLYTNALAPNTYILLLPRAILRPACQTAWEYLLTQLLTFTPIVHALFVEWYTIISDHDTPLNMNKNPHYEWTAPRLDLDSTTWYEMMCTTADTNNLCALGADRRHSSDLLTLTHRALPTPYPVQLVLYNFAILRTLGMGAPHTHTTNYLLRDTLLTLHLLALGGQVNTVPQFTVNAPPVTYTEDDIHQILQIPRRYKGVLNAIE